MKDNVIVLLVDSVYSECIGSRRTKNSSTPFLDKLASEGIYVPNMYSYGPYTNAATKALLCSEPTLNNYGYFFGINSAKCNHYKAFKDLGYETYGFYYPYYLISTNTKKSIDNTIYSSGFIYSAIWRGNYSYYKELKDKHKLSATEYILLEKFTDMLFELWIDYYEECLKDAQASILLSEFADITEMKDSNCRLKAEYLDYKKDKIKYIDKILDEGMKHPFAHIDKVDIQCIPKLDFIRSYIYKEHKDFFSFVERKTCCLNQKNNPTDLAKIIKSIYTCIKTFKKDSLRYLYNNHLKKHTQKKMIRDTFNGVWQEHPSAKNQIKKALTVLDNKSSNEDKPFYLFMHFLEVHERIAYFSYDIDDPEEIDKEIFIAKELVDNCGDEFKGSLVYQLALRYIDHCVEYFYNELGKRNLLENTALMIIADHGSSYTYYPIRDSVVNNFHRENYNIPAIIWRKKTNHRGTYTGKYTSIDAFPTLLSECNLPISQEFWGQPMWEIPNGREIIVTEYMGPGTPDMLTRDVWISARSDHYMIAYICPLNGDFDLNSRLIEAYDLREDHYELKDISKKSIFNNYEILRLKQEIKNRFENIVANRDSFISNISNIVL